MPRLAPGSGRGNGEGSIYMRKDGRWCASMSIGKNQWKYFYGQSRGDVSQKLIQAQFEQHESLHLLRKGLSEEPESRWSVQSIVR
jgi:hypothetical protein